MVGRSDDDHVAAVFDEFDMCAGVFFDQSAAVHLVIKEQIVGPEQDADRNGQAAYRAGMCRRSSIAAIKSVEAPM